MKNFITFVLIFIFMSVNSAQATGCAISYLVKNSKSSNVKQIVEFYSRQSNMPVVNSENNYLNVQVSNLSHYFSAFEQKGDDTVFYYYSSDENSKVHKEILKRIKINGYKYSKLSSAETSLYSAKYKNLLEKSLTKTENYNENMSFPENADENVSFAETYDFSDEAQQKYNVTNPLVQNNSNPIVVPQPNVVNNSVQNQLQKDTKKNMKDSIKQNSQNVFDPDETVIPLSVQKNLTSVPANMSFSVVLQSTINTASLDDNDRISALLQNDLYVNGQIIAKQGSIVYGTAVQAEKAGRAYANGSLKLVFDKILTTDGEELTLQAEPIIYKNADSNRGAKIAGNMAGAMALSMAAAAIMGAIGHTDSWARTLAIGAGTGAFAGGVSVMSNRGEDVELKEGAVLQIKTVR